MYVKEYSFAISEDAMCELEKDCPVYGCDLDHLDILLSEDEVDFDQLSIDLEEFEENLLEVLSEID